MQNPADKLNNETLQARASGITNAIGNAVGDGLSLSELKSQEKKFPKLNRDFYMTLLGIKPLASGIMTTLQTYYSHSNYLPYFSNELDIGKDIHYGIQTSSVWNASEVDRVLQKNSDLVSVILKSYPIFDELIDPRGPNFDYAIQYLTYHVEDKPIEANILAGLLLGFPRKAAEYFSYDIEGKKSEVTALIINAIDEGLVLPDFDFSLHNLVVNPQLRETYSNICAHFGVHPIPHFDEMRYADVPGSPYITHGSVTEAEEKERRELYESSGLEENLAELLR